MSGLAGRIAARLIGGRFDRAAVTLSATPPHIVIDGQRYDRIDDPDTGAFLGGYAAALGVEVGE